MQVINILVLIALIGLEIIGILALLSVCLYLILKIKEEVLKEKREVPTNIEEKETYHIPARKPYVLENNKPTYYESEYYKQKNLDITEVTSADGSLNEYRTYEQLNKLSGYKKFLFNCYIPKTDGSTTEVDIIFLHETGIYIIESKDYSGLIYGDQNDVEWRQVFASNGRKAQITNYFYNPLLQNQGHIKALQNYLDGIDGIAFYSLVVFGDAAIIRYKIETSSYFNKVLEIDDVAEQMKEYANKAISYIDKEKIDLLYEKLYPLTIVSDDIRESHIDCQERYKKTS